MDLIDFDIAFKRVYPGQNIKFCYQRMSTEDGGGYSDVSSYFEWLTCVARESIRIHLLWIANLHSSCTSDHVLAPVIDTLW